MNDQSMNLAKWKHDLASERALAGRRAAANALELPNNWLLDSPSLSEVVDSAKRLAHIVGAPILVQGERGSGVGELARLVHDEDPVASGKRFHVVSAHQVNTDVLRAGELAVTPLEGTLLLEDIEALRPLAQARITAIVEERWRRATLRIIASSRLSISDLLQQHQLSPELVDVLDVGRLEIPPLRRRPQDVLGLARRFLEHYADRLARPALHFSADAETRLLAHDYPGNVRELRNVVERATAFEPSDEIGSEAVVFYDERACSSPVLAAHAQEPEHLPSLEENERLYLEMLIRRLRGRRKEMARVMGVSYETVWRKIARHGINVDAIVAQASSDSDGMIG